MGNSYKGGLEGEGLRVGIVVARFNEAVTSRLLSGAQEGLAQHGVKEEDVDIAWTPGSLELALVAKKMAKSGRYSAIICLGAVIRGGTPHFDYVASGVTQGVVRANLETGVPVIFGVLTTDNVDQAFDRAGAKLGNKGFDAAMNAVEMANLLKELPGS